MAEPIVEFIRARLDEYELWALAASQTRGPAPEGGEHWQWERTDDDQPVTPDPATEEYLAEADEVGLRSVEQYPTSSVGQLPSMLIASYEVYAAAAGHIVRHDPAAVLRDMEAMRALLADIEAEKHRVVEDCWYTCPAATEERDGDTTCDEDALGGPCNCGRDDRANRRHRIIASRWSTHPDYRAEWRPEQ